MEFSINNTAYMQIVLTMEECDVCLIFVPFLQRLSQNFTGEMKETPSTSAFKRLAFGSWSFFLQCLHEWEEFLHGRQTQTRQTQPILVYSRLKLIQQLAVLSKEERHQSTGHLMRRISKLKFYHSMSSSN